MPNNSLTAKKEKSKFSVTIQSDAYKNLINSTLGDPKRAQRFIAAVSSAVATTQALQECEAGSVLTAALLGESLDLSPSPQLGQYYMVPYGGKAQFQLGYKGYVQLAERSGYYRKLNVLAIKKGELISYNPLEEEVAVELIENELDRESAETMGYYAMFEYHNGFKKAMYWSIEKMEGHADKYSKAFDLQKNKKLKAGELPANELWKYSSFWYKDFDAMACKTMLRQLISKWGIMSIELQTAIEKDLGIIHMDGTAEFVDTPEEDATATIEDISEKEQVEEPKMEYSNDKAVENIRDEDDFFLPVEEML